MNILKLLSTYFLSFLFVISRFSLATDYQNNATRSHCSFVIWIIDTVDLFIHETGHLVFTLFGRFMEFLGGSLFQVIIPLATMIVFAQSSRRSLPFTLYWTGQSIVNVSVYVGDAHYQRLQLISRATIHDWRWLFNYTGMIEYAEEIAIGVNFIGLIICVVGIGIGFYFVVRESIQLSSQK